jgi:hypothetical protein
MDAAQRLASAFVNDFRLRDVKRLFQHVVHGLDASVIVHYQHTARDRLEQSFEEPVSIQQFGDGFQFSLVSLRTSEHVRRFYPRIAAIAVHVKCSTTANTAATRTDLSCPVYPR